MKPIHVSTKGSCHSASRYSKAAFALSHARSALDGFSQGSHIFGLTKGQFSIIDLATVALDISGPAKVCIWTWSIAEYEVEVITRFVLLGRILDFRMIMEAEGAIGGGNISGRTHQRGNLIKYIATKFGNDSIRLLSFGFNVFGSRYSSLRLSVAISAPECQKFDAKRTLIRVL